VRGETGNIVKNATEGVKEGRWMGMKKMESMLRVHN
jgi:hypothetical protein